MPIEEQKELTRVYQQVQRAKMLGLPATLTFGEWIAMIDRFGGLCAYCQSTPFEAMDHLIPVDLGGGTVAQNCIPSCSRCNSRKSGRNICDPVLSLDEQIEQVRHVLQNNVRIPIIKNEVVDTNEEQRISIRFPLDVLEALRQSAKADDRSFNGEVLHLLRLVLVQDQKEQEAQAKLRPI